MNRQDKIAHFFFLSLLPVTAAALVWSVSGLRSGTLSNGFVALMLSTVVFGSVLRIQLPRTNLYLTVSDAIVMFSLIVYGGGLAVVLTAAASAFSSAVFARREGHKGLLASLINISISIVTVFVTAAAATSVFGVPGSIPDILNTWNFILLIALLTLLPFAINSCLAAAFLAIKGGKSFIDVWQIHSLDAILIYFGAALMSGLFVVALHEINIFLFLTVAGFFGILQLILRRYAHEQKKTIANAERSEKEGAEMAEQHVVQLEHYIAELETSGNALTESRERFRHAAYHDSLTDLPNRNQFIEKIDAMLRRTRVDKEYRFALLNLDLHSFKTVNDSLGHSMGDRLISNVAERLSKLVWGNDHVGRFGGDEFAILLSGINGAEDAIAFAQKVTKAIAEPFVLDERQVFTRASIGIAIGNAEYTKAEDILRDADMAMYRAKEKSRSYVIFADELLARARSNLQLETDLRFAVERDELELYYQPIIDLEYSQMIGFEALVRWNHPKLGQIEPDRFIPASEATGLIVPMTLQILEKACLQLVEWQEGLDGQHPLFVSVNLSGIHFAQSKLVDDIASVLEKTQINPRSLKLEITETAVMENAVSAISILRQIKDLGVQISIDDFGTGYSSLSYLQQFPIDTLKIDRAFVGSMEDGRQNGEIVRAVLALAAAMRLSVVAEGIESIHQLHQLKILNCQYGQGYLFSPPLPAAEFETLISDQFRWQNLASGGTFAIVSPGSETAETFVQ